MNPLRFVGSIAITLCACTVAPSSSGTDTSTPGGGKADSALTTECQAAIEQAVLTEARALNESAQIIEQRQVYGIAGQDSRATYGDVVLVRVSDETEPSDWIAITHRNEGEHIAPSSRCIVDYVATLASGLLSDELATARAVLPNDVCLERLDAAVLGHESIAESASVLGRAPVYGESTDEYSHAMLVRTSDEDERKDFVVVYDAEDCVVENLTNLSQGLLPEGIAGLPDVDGEAAGPPRSYRVIWNNTAPLPQGSRPCIEQITAIVTTLRHANVLSAANVSIRDFDATLPNARAVAALGCVTAVRDVATGETIR